MAKILFRMSKKRDRTILMHVHIKLHYITIIQVVKAFFVLTRINRVFS